MKPFIHGKTIMTAEKTHAVRYFMCGTPKTICGIYVAKDKATPIKENVTCKACLRHPKCKSAL